jgi:putative tryptophan/tyrosine transport system substrate-binding protein
MERRMHRRQFIAAVGGAAALPLTAYAQQPSDHARRIGVLMPYTRDNPEDQQRVAAFQEGLKRLGWIEGRNIRSEYRWYAGDSDRARSSAKELVDLKPDLILVGASPGLVALRHETRSLPIVFVAVTDPVGLGLVESLARPGGNATGFTFFEFSVGTKLLESLQQIAPRVRRIALMYSPNSPVHDRFLGPIDAIGPSTAVTLLKMPVRDAAEIEIAIEAFGREPDSGLMVLPEPLFPVHQKLIVELAARYKLPTVYPFRLFTVDGGLMSYSVDVVDLYGRAAGYVDRILKGSVAAEMPVQQPTKYELVINLKTAKALGLEVPSTLLARADEVIE